MAFEDYEALQLDRTGRVLSITMNRPEQLNAVDAVMHEELARVFYEVARDPHSDLVVLTGAGRAFSAGGDFQWFQSMIDDPPAWEKTRVEAKQIVFGLLDCEKPIIAKVNGHAMGLGATLALFCDVIFASKKAKIGDPHVSVGMVAGDGGAVIWPQLIGYARAKEYLMTGDPIGADDAAAMGLINHAVEPDDLDDTVAAFVQKLSTGAMQSIRYSKASVNIGLKQLAHSIMDASLAYESITNFSADHQEAVRAFLDKRKPNFIGR